MTVENTPAKCVEESGDLLYDFRLPCDAILEANDVAVFGAAKYGEARGEERWLGASAEHHVQAAKRHIRRWDAYVDYDEETGRSHLAHAAARILFALAIELRGDECPSAQPVGLPMLTSGSLPSSVSTENASTSPKLSTTPPERQLPLFP